MVPDEFNAPGSKGHLLWRGAIFFLKKIYGFV
jgi:hypothetical protein